MIIDRKTQKTVYVVIQSPIYRRSHSAILDNLVVLNSTHMEGSCEVSSLYGTDYVVVLSQLRLATQADVDDYKTALSVHLAQIETLIENALERLPDKKEWSA